jgi:phenylalanyl-tRNA synthetase beta chain
MQEIFTYPWMTDEFVHALFPSTEGILALATPPAPNEKYIRSSLLPNICKAIVKNERNFDEFDIFEEAQIFLDSNYTADYPGEKLPCQKKHLGCAFVGAPEDVSGLFRRAKGVIGMMPRYTHMEGFTFEKQEKPGWADDTVWLNIFLNGEKIGDLALLSKKAALACGIKVLSAVLVELDMDALKPFKSRTNRFVRMSEFPVNEYDISFLVDSMTKWEEIYNAITGKKHELLKDASFVDEYKGKQIPEGKKSVTVRLSICSDEKTLTGQEIEAVANSVIKKLTKTIGADVRNG